eukprot:SAG22_NODE_634_length_8373_cov_4.731085_6_plen_54_part_00
MVRWYAQIDAENGLEFTAYTCRVAARGGHLEVLKWRRCQNQIFFSSSYFGCSW